MWSTAGQTSCTRWTWTAWRLRQVGGHRRVVGGLGGQRRVDGNLGQRTLVCRLAVLLVRGAANQRAPRSFLEKGVVEIDDEDSDDEEEK